VLEQREHVACELLELRGGAPGILGRHQDEGIGARAVPVLDAGRAGGRRAGKAELVDVGVGQGGGQRRGLSRGEQCVDLVSEAGFDPGAGPAVVRAAAIRCRASVLS
jgi:hypothetical protein